VTEPLDSRRTEKASIAGPKLGEVVARKYRIDALIGEGGMGKVFAGENLATGKKVALKWLPVGGRDPVEAIARFRREARAAGRIDHPNVIQLYDVIEDGESTYLVMELLRGESLASVLAREGKLAVSEAAGILIEVARGVAAIHAAGVVHRDLKPDNVFLSRADTSSIGVVKVMDFGVSKVIATSGDSDDSLRLTRTGTVLGTPYYLAPEQVRGMKEIDARVDVYALGVVFYELVAGHPPFRAPTFPALVVEIATATPAPLSSLRADVPPEVDRVVERAMARERDERFPDVVAFARALEAFAEGFRFSPSGPDWTGRIRQNSKPPVAVPSRASTIRAATTGGAPRPARRRAPLLLGLGAVGLLLAGGVYFAVAPSSEPPDARPAASSVAPERGPSKAPEAERPPPAAAPAEPAVVAQPPDPPAAPVEASTRVDSPEPGTEVATDTAPPESAPAGPGTDEAPERPATSRSRRGPRSPTAMTEAAAATGPSPMEAPVGGRRAGEITLGDFE
jgi:serine/threonine-protein kinase